MPTTRLVKCGRGRKNEPIFIGGGWGGPAKSRYLTALIGATGASFDVSSGLPRLPRLFRVGPVPRNAFGRYMHL